MMRRKPLWHTFASVLYSSRISGLTNALERAELQAQRPTVLENRVIIDRVTGLKNSPAESCRVNRGVPDCPMGPPSARAFSRR
jgi:hypothetical protein